MKIAILTDSAYDGKASDFKDLYIIPLMIAPEDGNQIYDDDSLNKDDFYKLLDSQSLKTSQSAPGDIMAMWDKLLVDYDQVIFAPISSGLSGQFNLARMLSETEEAYKGKIFVCDTKGVSIILQTVIRHIAFWIAENKTGFEILELVKELSSKFTTFIIPKNLETLKRGGRISSTAAALAKMLKIIPILRYNGSIDKENTARTYKKAIAHALNIIKKECKNIKVIDVAYSRFDQEDLDLIVKLIHDEGLTIGLYSELTNVICSHTGRETVALVGWRN
ncbi:DegV family protein [Mesoplasma syrphidae]|uniref:DegV family protein n=1 Tax=Mesoplasma syrphidae TaxID=225999 RepID=A0A2K9BQS6_9MOLU|nr:DegV family protein [Mesoplasma syrphidae]AUF83362.1 DegV family protein [Mesoplasma syrphidae]